MIRRVPGAGGRRGQARRRTPASEWRGASPCPPHPEPGHFLYDRWADAGCAAALRTIVRNRTGRSGQGPRGRAGAGERAHRGRSQAPLLLQPPAPRSGSRRVGMLLPRPPRFRRRRLPPPPGLRARNPTAGPAEDGRAAGRRSNASWAQSRRSSGLQSRLHEGPLPS